MSIRSIGLPAWLACVFAASAPGCSGDISASGGHGDGAAATGGSSGAAGGGSGAGAGGTSGAPGSGGTGGLSGGGTGGRADAGAGADAGTGADGPVAASPCVAGRFAICEDFEATAVGAIPTGWGKQPSSTSNVQVAADRANSGSHALKILAQASGGRAITKTAAQLGALAAAHWGRMFYRVQTPPPLPSSGNVIHSTLVAGSGVSPLPVADNVNVRLVDTVVRADGVHQFLYNVQPSSRSEFAKEGPYSWSYEDRWHCVEWYASYATQSYRFFFDGAEVTQMAINNGAGNFNRSEIPASFATLAFGWNNYQAAGAGYVAWIDDIALDANRVGCSN